MNRFLIFFLCGSIFIGCVNKENEKAEKQKQNDEKNDLPITKKQLPFDTQKFLDSVNKHLGFEKKSIFLQSIDTLFPHKRNINSEKIISALNHSIDNSLRTLKFEYKNKTIKIRLYIFEHKDNSITKESYSYIKHMSGKVSDFDDGPGLTYSNDFVTYSNSKIYWLNSLCLVSYKNHLKLSNSLKGILKIKNVNEIYCKCGRVVCEIKE